MRTMCTYEHGIRDRVQIIRDDDYRDFNRELQFALETGWRLIQPIETHVVETTSSYGRVYHVATLAKPLDEE